MINSSRRASKKSAQRPSPSPVSPPSGEQMNVPVESYRVLVTSQQYGGR
jgi:hypothetical protein